MVSGIPLSNVTPVFKRCVFMSLNQHLWRIIESLWDDAWEVSPLSESETHLTNKVLRLEVGETIEVTNLKGYVWKAKIVKQSKTTCFVEKLDTQLWQQAGPHLCAMIGTPKPAACEEVVQLLSEMGIPEIFFFEADLQKTKQVFKLEKLVKIALESARIHKVPFGTQIHSPKSLEECLRQNFDVLLVCDEFASWKTPWPEFPKQNGLKIGFVVGPESSLSEGEKEFLQQKRAQFVSLGAHILRVPLASVKVASKLLLTDSFVKQGLGKNNGI